MSDHQLADAGAVAGVRPEPRLLALVDQWRAEQIAAGQFSVECLEPDFAQEAAVHAETLKQCADQLSAALRAEGIARPPQEEKETKDDHARVDKGIGRRSTGSTATTD
jgi:hypothetical protein